MTVKELIEILKTCPQDLPIALSVYGHAYSSEDHKISHGKMVVRVGQGNGIRQSVFLLAGTDRDVR